MERSPPPIFNQGVSAHARLLLCAGLAIALLVVDSRLQTLSALRQGAATLLYPLQRALLGWSEAAADGDPERMAAIGEVVRALGVPARLERAFGG